MTCVMPFQLCFSFQWSTPGAPSLVSHRLPVNFCKGKLFNFVGPSMDKGPNRATLKLWIELAWVKVNKTDFQNSINRFCNCASLFPTASQSSEVFHFPISEAKFIQDPPLPRPPFAPRPRPFPGEAFKVPHTSLTKPSTTHHPTQLPSPLPRRVPATCLSCQKKCRNSRVFWKGFRDMSTPEAGTSKVDAGKTPSETRCSLVIAPKTLDLRVQHGFGMLLDVSSLLHQYLILQIRQILCSIFRGIGELGIWTCWTFVLHLFVSSWRPIIILSSVLVPTILCSSLNYIPCLEVYLDIKPEQTFTLPTSNLLHGARAGNFCCSAFNLKSNNP